MRYIVLLKAARPNTPPPDELFAAIMKLGDEATNAGVLLDNAGLLPSVAGAQVAVANAKLTVTDGPFAEAKEMISYALYDVHSKDEVVEWTRRFVKLHLDLWPGWEGEARILKVMGPEDYLPSTEPHN
jgi:hypothetical protein